MLVSKVDALLIGQPVRFRADGAASSIGSRQSAVGPVRLEEAGFAGDRVGDPSVHGDADKAVHFYPAEHYRAWQADFAKAELAPHPHLEKPGGFGENLCGQGLTEGRVRIGDRFRIGSALVEISQGRQPCWKIDHHFGMRGMTASVIRSGRSGYYFRVIEGGSVSAGDGIEQVEQAPHDWTVAATFYLLIGGGHLEMGARAALKQLAQLATLAENWRQRALQLGG
jgi:MOSC domain-containing protein YiiM